MKKGQLYRYVGPGRLGVSFGNGKIYDYIDDAGDVNSKGDGSGGSKYHYFEEYEEKETETKELSAKELYAQLQKFSGFKVGDRVKIVRGFEGNEWGANCGYFQELGEWVGKEVKITKIIDTGVEVNKEWYFPFFCLELISRSVEIKLNEDYTAVVAGDKKTVTVGCQTFSREKILELAKELN